ncbi:MAG: TIGR04255 family protein [Thermoleophilaceae bacterium]
MDKIKPLAFVAAEIRTSYTPALVKDETLAEIQDRLPTLPIAKREHRQAIIVGGPMQPGETVLRLMTADMTTSLTLTAGTIALETTAYESVEAFTGLLEAALNAIGDIAPPPAVERVGLRYVNELRLAEAITNPSKWENWVCPELLAPFAGATEALSAAGVDGVAFNGAQTVLSWQLSQQRALIARLGPVFGPPAVGSDPLRRPVQPGEGPFFLVDLDGFWPNMPAPAERYDPTRLLSTVRELHAPIEATFLWATTEKFRKEAL